MTSSVTQETLSQPLGKLGVVFEGLQDPSCNGPVVDTFLVDQVLNPGTLDLFSECDCMLREWCCTAGTEALPATQCRVAVRTGVKLDAAFFIRLDQIVVFEDLLVDLFIGDARVDLELLAVFRPVGAVFNHLVTQPFADPPGDGGLTEQMGVDSIGIDTRVFGDEFDPSGEVLLRECAVVVFVPLFKFVDERGVWVITPWMHVQPVGDVPPTPGQRLRPGGVFDVCILVDVDDCYLIAKFQVSNSKGSYGTHPQSSVVEQCNDCLISGVLTGIEQLLYFGVREQVIRVDVSLWTGPDGDFVVPLPVQPPEKDSEGLAVVSPGAFRQVILTLESREEDIDVVNFHLCEWDFGTFRRQPESIQMGHNGAGIDRVLCVFISHERLDLSFIDTVDIAFFEPSELVFKLSIVPLNVIDTDHYGASNTPGDYNISVNRPPGTTQKVDIVHPVTGWRFSDNYVPNTIGSLEGNSPGGVAV